MKLSEFLGKKILCGGREGYIVSAVAEGQAVYFVCADCDEKEFTVDSKNVISSAGGFVCGGTVSGKKSAPLLRLGRACFDMRGKYLGKLEDFNILKGQLKSAKIGKKNYPFEGLILGDVIIVKPLRRLKSDVIKDGTTLFKKGEYVTDSVLFEAAVAGEYVQTRLKSI